jgi:hypothetical protein
MGLGLAHQDERVETARAEANLGAPVRTPVPGVYEDSVAPVIEAELGEMIKIEGEQFLDGFSFHPTPGHSIDHASILLRLRWCGSFVRRRRALSSARDLLAGLAVPVLRISGAGACLTQVGAGIRPPSSTAPPTSAAISLKAPRATSAAGEVGALNGAIAESTVQRRL